MYLLLERPDYSIVLFAYLLDLVSKEFIALSLFYDEFSKLGLEIAFYYGSAVAGYKIDLLKCPFSRHSGSERLDYAIMPLIRCFL